jgi:cytochrome oxidase Cu insertion factor (SCO1/SenC/PrrC family)
MTSNANMPGRSNATLWLLLASFILPAVAAYAYFFFGDRPEPDTYGELITPVVDIETLELTDVLDNPIPRKELTSSWRMFYISAGSCAEQCEQSLYNMRQINTALGKNQSRVDHAVLHSATVQPEFIELLEQQHPHVLRARIPVQKLQLLQLQNPAQQSAIYLMDPHGNIMMRFADGLDPKLILKEINKLLKISRIG